MRPLVVIWIWNSLALLQTRNKPPVFTTLACLSRTTCLAQEPNQRCGEKCWVLCCVKPSEAVCRLPTQSERVSELKLRSFRSFRLQGRLHSRFGTGTSKLFWVDLEPRNVFDFGFQNWDVCVSNFFERYCSNTQHFRRALHVTKELSGRWARHGLFNTVPPPLIKAVDCMPRHQVRSCSPNTFGLACLAIHILMSTWSKLTMN